MIIMKRRRYSLLSVLVLVVVVAAAAIVYFAYNPSTKTKNITINPKIHSSTVKKTNQTASNQHIQHIFLIVDENKPSSTIVGNTAAPYLNKLINQYAYATNYSGVTHPSLPNYLALTSGSTDGITTDCNPPSAGCEVNVKNIADEIQNSGRTWKAYAESMPSSCYSLNYGNNFATKHVPFLYYKDIIGNSSRCDSHVVPFTQMATDLQSVSTTPNYAFITPNLCNDMHNCPVSTGDSWLSTTVPEILNSKAFTTQKSLLIITWDEGYVGDNVVPAIFVGNTAKQGYKASAAYNHYSVLHTIEYLWNLKPLTSNDQQAPLMTSMLNNPSVLKY